MSEQLAVATRPPSQSSRNVIANNPNATVALTSGSGFGALVVWASGVIGLSMPAEIGAVVGALVASFALFIGRSGLRGALQVVWGGSQG